MAECLTRAQAGGGNDEDRGKGRRPTGVEGQEWTRVDEASGGHLRFTNQGKRDTNSARL